jgi:hypothetical protein
MHYLAPFSFRTTAIAQYDGVLVINLNLLWPMDGWVIIDTAYSHAAPFCILATKHSY